MKKIVNLVILVVSLFGLFSFSFSFASAGEDMVNVLMFTRDECGHCQDQKAYLNNWNYSTNFSFTQLNLADEKNQKLFKEVVDKYNLAQVTPITFVGDSVLTGFDEDALKKAIFKADGNKKYALGIKYYLGGNVSDKDYSQGSVCDLDSDSNNCSIEEPVQPVIKEEVKESISIFGNEIKFKNWSLFSLSVILGFVDGFNPCAMWVLITFLLALSQIGDKKKMAIVAGTFILAESIMYFLILNLWSSAWDFIGMQKVVTIIIGLIAIAAGIYFLYKAYKNRGDLTCDSSSSEHQAKIMKKINEVASEPFTIITIFSILFIAFSVNIIEFACSAGIPQTFTKILDMNNLSFIQEQFYILIYTILYMVDDLVVFGLAIWGSAKFYQVGAKYSHITTIIAGVLILLLGVSLIFFPQALVF